MTLPARVVVLRSLILSVATHVLSMVTINTDRLSILQKLCNDFLWRGHNRLQEKTVQNTLKWGGLKYVHIKHVMHKICIKWMIYIWEDRGLSWSQWVWPQIIRKIPEQVLLGMTNCAEHLVQHLFPFYKGVLRSYAYMN